MCGDLFGKKSARKTAQATLKAAADQAAADRLAAQAVQRSQETSIAQIRASEQAKELLNVPMEQVQVDLAVGPQGEVDPVTNRRRPTRQGFMSNAYGGSGIKIN